MSDDATIALLLPTRFRASMAVEALQSIATTVGKPELLRVIVGIDDDDAESLEMLRAVSMSCAVTLDVQPHARGMNHRLHLMLPAAAGCDVVGFFADDVRMATQSWDDAVREGAALMPAGYGVMYFRDPLHPLSPTYPLVTAAMIEELGFFFEPYTPYWFSDTWLDEIAAMIACSLPLKPKIENPHGKGKTRHMRELPFWADWFNATRPRRIATAQRLIPRMYPAQRALVLTLLNDLSRRALWLAAHTNRFKDPGYRRVIEGMSMEAGEPPDSYLEAKRIAIEYVRDMRAELGIVVDDQFTPLPPRRDPAAKNDTAA